MEANLHSGCDNDRQQHHSPRLAASAILQEAVKAEGLSGSLKSLFHKTVEIVPALGEFDLEIKRGEMLGVIGPSRAGKTTLVKLLSGLTCARLRIAQVLGFAPMERRTVDAFLSRVSS